MPLKRLKSPPAQSSFAPRWELPLGIEMLNDPATLTEIRDLVLQREAMLKSQIPARPVSGIEDGLTSRWHSFNIFAWDQPAMRRFRDFVFKAYQGSLTGLGVKRQKCWVQGWANVVRGGEKFAPHCHDQSPHAYVSGNFTVACQDSSTIDDPPYLYQDAPNEKMRMPIQNQPGMLTLFPSAVLHETSQHAGDRERITLASDIFLQDYDLGGGSGPEGLHIVMDDPVLAA